MILSDKSLIKLLLNSPRGSDHAHDTKSKKETAGNSFNSKAYTGNENGFYGQIFKAFCSLFGL